MYECTNVWVWVCVCVHTLILYIYIYIYIYMYVYIYTYIHNIHYPSLFPLVNLRVGDKKPFWEYAIWKDCAKINADMMAQNHWNWWLCLVPDSVALHHTGDIFAMSCRDCRTELRRENGRYRLTLKTKRCGSLYTSHADWIWKNCSRIVHFGNRSRCPANQLLITAWSLDINIQITSLVVIQRQRSLRSGAGFSLRRYGTQYLELNGVLA